MVFGCLLRSCGILGYGLNGDRNRLVLAIAAEASKDASEECEEPEASAFAWLSLSNLLPARIWGQTKGGLCTQALLAVLSAASAAGRGWGSMSFQQLHGAMEAVLGRSGVEASVTLRCSRDLLDGSLDMALIPSARARALLIGICYGEDDDVRLEGSWNDVQDMRQWLLREGLVREQDVRILSDVSGALVPSRSNILAHLQWLLSSGQGELEETTQLFLLFAGHGDRAELLPSDWRQAGPIRERDISELVDELPCGARLCCIFDCCDSSRMLVSLLRYHLGAP